MPEQRRQFAILYRDFLFRIVDLELLASRGEAQRLLIQFAAMLGAFSFTFCIYFIPRYALSTLPWEKLRQFGWMDQDLLIATTMAIAGMFTVMAWNNVLPDRRDRLILGLLPVRPRTILLAKLAALGTCLGVAVAAINAFTGIAYPFANVPPGGGMGDILRAFFAYWVALLASGLFVCCTLLAVQAVAALLLPYRAFLKLSNILQMAAFFVLLGGYFLKPPYRRGLTWVPSYWFLGLFQKLNGAREFDLLASMAVRALAIVCPLAVIAFTLAYLRYNRIIVEQPDIAPSDRSHPSMRLVSWLAAKLIPRPVHRAVVLFTARTILRSRHHRLLLAVYGGIGLGIAMAYARDLLYGVHSYERIWSNPHWDRPNPQSLVGSLVMLFFVVIGARAVFSQPIALRSNWIFRLTAVERPTAYFAAVRQSLYSLVVLPVVLAWSALFFAIWPAGPAARHTIVMTLGGYLMVQLLLRDFRKIPFACSYLPGKGNMHVKLGLFAIAFLGLTNMLIELEYRALQSDKRFVILTTVLLALSFWAYRRNARAPDAEIIFEELPPADIEALDLHSRGPRGGTPVTLPPLEIPRAPFSAEQFFRDLANATRILTRSPGLSIAAIVLIAVGIGGNAAIYSMVHSILSKPAPAVSAENLVTVGAMRDGRPIDPGEHSYPEYLAYAANSRAMQSVTAIKFERFNLTLADGSSAHLRGELVTRNYFQTVGVPLARGREFTVAEARGAAPLPAIITDAVWREQFHQSDDVLGQSVLLNGVPATIVGVTPPGFHGTSFAPNLQICVPVVAYSRLRGKEAQLIDPKVLGVGILGRLAPHASIETAQKEFDNLWADEDGRRALLAPYTATAFGPNSGPQARRFMTILMAAALLTLLVVCGNVANLLLARSVARRREIAIRLSLGAPLSRIVRSLLAEGMVLSLAATAAALLFAEWATRAVVALIGFDVDLTPDRRVVGYALLLAVVCTLVFSIAPAWRAVRDDLAASFKQRSKTASVLMVAQLALCVVLLVAGGLAWRSLSMLETVDLGFVRDHLLLASVGTADGTDLERVRQSLLAVPGVQAASWAIAAPPHSHPWMGLPAQATSGGVAVPTDGTQAGPDYLRTLGVPILEGREGDVVINRKMAQALWPGESAVGRTFLLGNNVMPLTVAGVVPDAAFNGVGEDGSFSGISPAERRPFLFIPDARIVPAGQDRTFHIRYLGSLNDIVPGVRAAIHRTDSRLSIFGVRTMRTEWEEFTSPVRIVVTLVACFALGGLLVASVGLYAVVAFYTGRRTRELGIRAALGATPAQAAARLSKRDCGLPRRDSRWARRSARSPEGRQDTCYSEFPPRTRPPGWRRSRC